MRVVKWNAYGPPEGLQLAEMEKPIPGPDEVLIRIHATTVFAGDCELRRFEVLPSFWLPMRLYIGLRRPRRLKVLGQEASGVIVATGAEVSDWQPGDEVFAPLSKFGGYAEYVCVPTSAALARKPAALSHAEAAALCVGGLNALYFFRKAAIKAGEQVLLVGAGGSIGTILLQLVRQVGAEVTVVDSADKLPALIELGAKRGIDYRSEDIANSRDRYDVVFNLVNKSSFSTGMKLLKDDGRLVLVNTFLLQLLRGAWINRTSRKAVISGIAGYHQRDLDELAARVAAGELRVLIDRSFRLEDMVEAHRYVDSGARIGNVVIKVADDASSPASDRSLEGSTLEEN